MNVNLRQLRAFICIGRVASFTKAAGILNATQPTLSAQIRELEQALDVRLFERNTRSVSLTAAGEDLLPAIEQLLGDLDQVLERARDASARIVGRVAIAALPSVCSRALPRAIAAFRSRNPGVSIQVRDAVADRAVELVRTKSVDFGIGSAIDDPRIEFVPIMHDHIVAVLPRDHRLAASRTITLQQLLRYPLILMDRDSSVRHIVDSAFASVGRMAVPEFEATFMSSAVGMVRAGLGITLLPSSAYEVTTTDVAIRHVRHPALRRSVGIIKLRGRSLTPAADSFLQIYMTEAKSDMLSQVDRARSRRVGAATARA